MTTTKLKLGFIGLGSMGAPMALIWSLGRPMVSGSACNAVHPAVSPGGWYTIPSFSASKFYKELM